MHKTPRPLTAAALLLTTSSLAHAEGSALMTWNIAGGQASPEPRQREIQGQRRGEKIDRLCRSG